VFLKTFRWSFAVTGVALVAAFLYGGPAALFLTLVLGVLEVSLSFDNAVVNARVLERMSPWWQNIFLTVGIVIAVFGMRLLFPLVVVGVTANMSPARALSLALEKGDPDVPGTYGYLLHEAHPQIAGFGGMFLLMLFLNFVFTRREILWISWVERPLSKAARWENSAVIVAIVVLVCLASLVVDDEDTGTVLLSGLLGMGTYLVVRALSNALGERGSKSGQDFSGPSGAMAATGKAAFGLFLYLEVLDASFSFDGVIGAFAITADPVIIALGLGLIGAMFVRSLTIYLVRKGTLNEFVHLDHGAHWAIGALAVILLATITVAINELITGFVGALLIAIAFWTSIVHNRRLRRQKSTAE